MNFKVLSVLLLVMTGSGCSCTTIEAGYVGVKVDLYGTDKGVSGEEVGPGRYFIGFNERMYEFPTFEQNYVWTQDERQGSETDESFTFQTKEGLTVNADFGINYTIDPAKVDVLFQTYRKGINEITDVFLRAEVRDALNQHASVMPVEGVYGERKMELIRAVEQSVTAAVAAQGITIKKVYLSGTFRLPPSVTSALDAKIEATQRAQQRENELREAEAKAKKVVAEAEGEARATLTRARAQAEANGVLAKSLTSALVEYERVKKWDGKLPQVSGGATPMVTLGGGAP